MAKHVRLCRIEEVPAGTVKAVGLEGREFAVFNVDGRFYVANDRCPHEGAPLSTGCLEGERISCAWHGATFHVPSGKTLEPPAGEKMGPPVDRGLTTYRTRVSGEELEVELEGE
ncbi:MAG TPA: Rieske 2Fe-2S domain-containing protein [candidate division Zixibacteria bacterium]|nr:Rieske 2Fe-2S domain-containing protein [candidate division Zixibacteria bacterium]